MTENSNLTDVLNVFQLTEREITRLKKICNFFSQKFLKNKLIFIFNGTFPIIVLTKIVAVEKKPQFFFFENMRERAHRVLV
jgi:hypothetical protein